MKHAQNKAEGLIPELRFPEFEKAENWEAKSLGDVAEVYQPKTISQTDLSEDGYPVYGANGIIGFYREYNHETNQIAIACRGSSCGTVNFTKPKSWITGNAMVVNVDQFKKIDKEFMFFQLDHANLDYLVTGSGQPQITGSIKKHEVFLPPVKEEQQKIASCLSSLDELIAAHNDKLDALKNHKKGLLQNLFPQEGDASTGSAVPKVRFPEFEDDGEWVETTLEQVADYQNGKAHEKDIDENGDYIVVNSKFISSEGETVKYSDTAFCPANLGDILMVLSDVPNGKAIAKCFYVDEENRYSVNQRICRITATDCDSRFLFYIMDRNAYFLSFDDGVKQTNLRKSDVLEFPFRIPTDPVEQTKIASCILAIDELIKAQTIRIEELNQHKRGLMQGLFPNPSASSGETIER